MKKNKILSLSAGVLASMIFVGCAGQAPLYTYGNYSSSYYAAKKDNNAQTALELQKSIEKAINNFKKEKEIYPEAGHFMDRMIKKVETMEGKNNVEK